eukprot:403376053
MYHLEVFLNTFPGSQIESLYSKRLLYLIETKKHFIQIHVVDVNTEISNLKLNLDSLNLDNSDKILKEPQFDMKNIREYMFEKYRLIKNTEDQVIMLPQVYLIQTPVIEQKKYVPTMPSSTLKQFDTSKHKKSRSELPSSLILQNSVLQKAAQQKLQTLPLRYYLGDYLTIQYLEDSGILDQILTGMICPHYRVFKSKPVFQFCKTQQDTHTAVEMCTSCFLENQLCPKYSGKDFKSLLLSGKTCIQDWRDVIIICNFSDNLSKECNDISLFFEKNFIPFRLIDPLQINFEFTPIYSQEYFNQKFLKEHNYEVQNSSLPLIFIHDTKVSLESVIEMAKRGTLLNILRKTRCLKCQKKLVVKKQSAFEQKSMKQNSLDHLCKQCQQSDNVQHKVSHQNQAIIPSKTVTYASNDQTNQDAMTLKEKIFFSMNLSKDNPQNSQLTNFPKQNPQVLHQQSNNKISVSSKLRESFQLQQIKPQSIMNPGGVQNLAFGQKNENVQHDIRKSLVTPRLLNRLIEFQ